MDFGARGIGGEIKLFPPPLYHGELDKWDDLSWQLKRYVGLYKPLAKIVTDGLCEAYDVQQTQTQNNQLSLFAKQLAYMLAQITDGAEMALRFGIIAFRLRQDHLESDLSDFIILKNRHEKTTGVPLDNDLLITLILQKNTGPLQQHLRNDAPVDMDIGALEGRKGYGKGKGKGKGGMYKGKGKGYKGKGMFKGKGKGKSKGFKGKKGYKGKGMFKGKGKGKSKGFKGKKGKGMKGKGKGQGCFICGDPDHWSKECPTGKGRMSALTEEEGQQEGNQEEWSQDAEWYDDEWDEYDWSQDWIGSLDDWSGDWPWSEDDWSYWSDDWSWGSRDWWGAEQPSASASSGTLIYLCPTVIPYAVADAARMAASCLPEVMDGIENELGSVELRGVTDMNDGSIDHLFQIGALIAAAQEMKAKEGY
eukprot:s60_g29.t2